MTKKNIREYQVTLICASGQYKPISTIVKSEYTLEKLIYKHEIQRLGITKICQKTLWSNADLKKYGYTKCKVREYDKEKIAKENAERYEAIKEAKYKNGEWQRPKEK